MLFWRFAVVLGMTGSEIICYQTGALRVEQLRCMGLWCAQRSRRGELAYVAVHGDHTLNGTTVNLSQGKIALC